MGNKLNYKIPKNKNQFQIPEISQTNFFLSLCNVRIWVERRNWTKQKIAWANMYDKTKSVGNIICF